MNTTKKFTSSDNPAELGRRCTAVFEASAALFELINRDVSEETQAFIRRVLDHGGRAGIEALVASDGSTSLHLVAIEPEGRRHAIAEVATVSGRPKAGDASH